MKRELIRKKKDKKCIYQKIQKVLYTILINNAL